MQAFQPPRPRPATPSPLVPQQLGAPGAEGAVEARPGAAPSAERPAVPAPRAGTAPVAGRGLPAVRARAAQPDAVVFTAPCPACSADCDWTEQREDTRLRAMVTCPCG